MLDAAVANGCVFYDGPVYDRRKESFYDSIDVLVFPSRYANEAEPVVVIEALGAGAPVAAARGCVPSLIDGESGLLLDPSGADLSPAVQTIRGWTNNPAEFVAASTSAIATARRLHDVATAAQDAFIAEMLREYP